MPFSLTSAGRSGLFSLLTLGVCCMMDPALAQGSGAVTLDAMQTALKSHSAVVFDIREPQEHAAGVAAGTHLLPMSQIGQRMNEIPKDQPVLLICNTQNRSSRVAEALRQRGWTQVQYVNGGMSTWAQRGLPMVKPAENKPSAIRAAKP
jgi:rhodanese-related sulfurtransferase